MIIKHYFKAHFVLKETKGKFVKIMGCCLSKIRHDHYVKPIFLLSRKACSLTRRSSSINSRPLMPKKKDKQEISNFLTKIMGCFS